MNIELQETSKDIWDTKYRLKDHKGIPVDVDVRATFDRVASTLAEVEEESIRDKWYKEFLWVLDNGAIPAGRIISNVGAGDYKPATSTINCTVSGTVEDSMDDILNKVHEAGLTLKSGCGIGYEFSTLRHKGACVKGAGAYTSGPLSFMDIYDKMCFTVSSAGGRRGAQMATFDISHPDALDFIKAKREDGRLRQFNLSLLITKEFVEAVKSDSIWDFKAVDTKEIISSIPAKQVWDSIISSTYDFAEPGFILIDEVNAMNNLWWCENIRATNPCLLGSTSILRQLPKGSETIPLDSVRVGDKIWSKEGWTKVTAFYDRGVKGVVDYKTTAGRLSATPNHKIDLKGKKVAIKDAKSIDTLAGPIPGKVRLCEQDIVDGLVLGDGTVHDTTKLLCIGEKDSDYFDSEVSNFIGKSYSKDYQYKIKTTLSLEELPYTYNREIPERFIYSDVAKKLGFLRGLFSAKGSVLFSKSSKLVQLKQSSYELITSVESMLYSVGINCYICTNKPSSVEQRNGTYVSKQSYNLRINARNSVNFAKLIGFIQLYKQETLNKIVNFVEAPNSTTRKTSTCTFDISETLDIGEHSVYDITVDNTSHTFWADGFSVSNCGEQPLPPYGACLLGSINLTKFVDKAFTPLASFNWDKYAKVISIFSRMLDNVIEVNNLPLKKQREEIERKRRHGMGFLGLGSALAMLQIPYGSKESIEFTDLASRTLAEVGWEAGLNLAKEKGAAPIMDEEFVVTTEMLKTRKDMVNDGFSEGDTIQGRILFAKYSRYMNKIEEINPNLINDLAKYGSRFSHHSSIAPTGTISLSLANNASNGIEPSFAHHYSRNIIKEGKKTKDKVDVYSYELLAYRALIDGIAEPSNLPDYFIDASKVTPRQHVDVQAAAQKWVDSSISKTINVPTDIPFEEFEDIYMYAYDKGLKGCTTFRFNPEVFQGVLVTEDNLKNTKYKFTLEDGHILEVTGGEEIMYDNESHTAANLFDALKEGYYGKF